MEITVNDMGGSITIDRATWDEMDCNTKADLISRAEAAEGRVKELEEKLAEYTRLLQDVETGVVIIEYPEGG